MEERPDLKQMVKERRTSLQALFEEWHLSGDIAREEENKEGSETNKDFQAEDWAGKLAKVFALFEGGKWSGILSDMQGMLEMAQIYLADLEEQHSKKKK